MFPPAWPFSQSITQTDFGIIGVEQSELSPIQRTSFRFEYYFASCSRKCLGALDLDVPSVDGVIVAAMSKSQSARTVNRSVTRAAMPLHCHGAVGLSRSRNLENA